MNAIHKRALRPGQRIRVLVVDDSVVIRTLVCHALEGESLIEVAGVAANGKIALDRVPQVNPDVISLDIEMPEMNGLEMLRILRGRYPGIRVVMFSTMTERGASATLEALALGAEDYVTKASNTGSLEVSMASLREQLIPKVLQFFELPAARHNGAAAPRPPARVATSSPKPGVLRQAIGIGISTGGPAALASILPQFPTELAAPVFIVQHMPPLFTRFLAERLDAITPLVVREATAGSVVKAGHAYIAPGDYHMRVVRRGDGIQIALDQSAPRNSCRPSVDVLFASLAEVYGGATVAAVLTGMGQDGLCGAEQLRARGACILAQDEPSSVVWGMPGAIVNAGVADKVLPLDSVVPELVKQVQGAKDA